jgi:hypothetical protein
MRFVTFVPLAFWPILAFCILAYFAWGVGGVVAVAVGGMLLLK